MKYIILLAVLFLGSGACAQFYIGGSAMGGLVSSTNSGLQFGAGGASRGYGDVVASGPMYSAQASVQYRRGWAWIESGFGAFTVTEAHKLTASYILGDYKNLNLRHHYWHIPIKLGATLGLKRGWSISPFVGVNYLAELTNFGRRWDNTAYFEAVPLETKAGSEYTAHYKLYQNDLAYAATLLCSGLRLEKSVTGRSSLQFGYELNIGLKVIQSNAMFATEHRGSGVTQTNFASTKGDGIGITVGYQYRLFSVKRSRRVYGQPKAQLGAYERRLI